MHQTHCTWQQLSFFFSSQNVQRYLARCYEKSSIQDAEKKSFENCYPFIYYLEHGKNYYELYKVGSLFDSTNVIVLWNKPTF